MPKPSEDIQDLKRRLVLLDRLDGRVLVCAEGTHVVVGARVRDAEAIVAACRAGRPSLAEVRAGLDLAGAPLLLGASIFAAAQRDLRVLASPRVAAVVRDAGRIFRRHGDLDAAWIAAKQARLAVLAEAARAASIADAGSGAFPPWFERVLEIVALVHGDDAASAVRAAADAQLSANARSAPRGARGAARSGARGRGAATPPVDARDERERALAFLAHGALAFDPRPRDGGDLALSKKDLALDAAAVRALAVRYRGVDLRLPEALALSRIELGHVEEAVARLVAGGLAVDKVVRLAEMKRAHDLAKIKSGAEGASAYAEWVITLGPHYASLGLELPLSPDVFDRMATARKSDLAVLAVCLLKHHTKADPDTAEQALARLDATLALFTRRPAEVASILGELSGTTAGAGREALPEIAAWLGDDAILDRFVHLSRIAGAAVALSRTLRADFDRGNTLAREKAHLEALAAPSAEQRARLARLISGQIEIPSPDRTRRRLAERVRELLAQAYEVRLDGVLRRIAKDAWGITVPRLTPGWRDAIRFYLVVSKNRPLLATVLRAAASGADLSRALPRNQAWIASVSSRFDVGAWLAPRVRDVDIGGKRHRLAVERDAIEVLRMGIPFDTCLSLEGGSNAASTVVNAADANKRVLYLRDARGRIVARKLLAVSRDHTLIGYRLYIAAQEHAVEITAAFRDMCARIAEDTGLRLAPAGTPKTIHAGFWYDDGAEPFDGSIHAVEDDVAAYCRSLGVAPPAAADEELRDEARLFAALRDEDEDALRTLLAACAWPLIAERAFAWLRPRLDRDRLTALVRNSSRLTAQALREAAREGYAPMLRLAGSLGSWMAGQGMAIRVLGFPPSLDLGLVMLGAAAASRRRRRKFDSDGLEHQTLDIVPHLVRRLPVASAFLLCDRAEPLWRWIEREAKDCADCVKSAWRQTIGAIVKAYPFATDPAAVIARLGGRSGSLARRAALAIAARWSLADGTDREAHASAREERNARPSREGRDARPSREGRDARPSQEERGAPKELFLSRVRPCAAAVRALAKLRRRAADLETEPDLFAAILRQAGGVPRGIELPVPSAPPFEALGDLIVQLDLGDVLAPWTGRDFDPASWKPGPWELCHLRRVPTPRGARIVEEAAAAARAAAPSDSFDTAAQEAFHRLALLGDVDAFRSMLAAHQGTSPAARQRRAIIDRARVIAKEIAGQTASARAEDPLSAERERRHTGRSKTRIDEQDRGLLLAALARLERHLASPADAGDARDAGRAADSSTAVEDDNTLALAFQLVLEADRNRWLAYDVAYALVFARDGRFGAGDRAILEAWMNAERERSSDYLPVPFRLHLLGDPALRPLALQSLGRAGIWDAWETYDALESLANATGRGHVVTGLFEDYVGALLDHGTTNLAQFETEPLFRRAVRVLLSRGVGPAATAYSKLTDHAMAALFLEELAATPMFNSDAIRQETRLWRERAKADVPATLEWLETRLDEPPRPPPSGPSSRPALTPPTAPLPRRRSRSAPAAPPGSPASRGARRTRPRASAVDLRPARSR